MAMLNNQRVNWLKPRIDGLPQISRTSPFRRLALHGASRRGLTGAAGSHGGPQEGGDFAFLAGAWGVPHATAVFIIGLV
jgi:hypothetical protein